MDRNKYIYGLLVLLSIFSIFILSGKIYALTCSDLEGAYVYSQEMTPVYLGFFGSSFASESIMNQFGTYGSMFSSLSVRNEFGTYGSSFSSYSANNQYTSSPPKIFKNRVLIGYLTTNPYIADGVSLSSIDASCTFYSSSPSDDPLPSLKPNLMPYKPSGWTDYIVASTITGTNSDSAVFYETDTIYIDWAVINDSNVGVTSFIIELSIDYSPVRTWLVEDLKAGYYTHLTDYPIGKLSAGSHIIQIKADSLDVIDESNEWDNSYYKTITVSKSVTLHTYFRDSDGDGFGDPSQSYESAYQPSGYVTDNTDCNDYDSSINPAAVDICGDGIDQDCDGADAICAGDSDDDLDGYTENQGDCDDSDAGIFPGNLEICGDGIDQDCDGSDAVCHLDLNGGYNVTSELWAKAIIEVPGNPVTLVWKEVGTDTTPSGAQVVSGYFYADPNDFAYGSIYNPEIFVKIYIDPNGWCNMAFNHVTVDDVDVYTAHHYGGSADQAGTVTLSARLAEHQYTGVSIDSSLSVSGLYRTLDDGRLAASAASAIDGGYILSSNLWSKAVLQVSGNPVTLIWKEVGSDTTPSGDRVVSGYFYADPNDFAYGSEYNPEAFVKVYIATNGWANIAYNHVTVDNVDVYSAHNYDQNPDKSSTVTLSNRLAEHQYDGVTETVGDCDLECSISSDTASWSITCESGLATREMQCQREYEYIPGTSTVRCYTESCTGTITYESSGNAYNYSSDIDWCEETIHIEVDGIGTCDSSSQ